jgi:hypothetical protein
MMIMNANEDVKKKKPYIKPQVKQVILRPEEAVLGACKTTLIAGPGQTRCSLNGLRCSTIGS